MRPAALVALCLVALAALPAAAHTRSQSYSAWRRDGDMVHGTYTVSAREVTRLAAAGGDVTGLDGLLADHLAERIGLRADDAVCPLVRGPRPLVARTGFVRVEMQFACPPGTAPLELALEAFFDLAPSHVHFARVRGDDGRSREFLFLDTDRSQQITADASGADPSPPAGATFARYVRLGTEHILIGWDHLAFLATLLLLGGRVRDVLWIVTGFTLGHSITLSLAVLGLVEPESGMVEALIGFTIALVAAENVGVTAGGSRGIAALAATGLGLLAVLSAFGFGGPPPIALLGLALFAGCYLCLTDTPEGALRLRPTLSVLFGLVHGFGFAGVLMEVGIPGDRIAPALLGFNVGVELGQIAIVALLFAATSLAIRAGGRRRFLPAADLASAVLCGLGLFWFVGRAYAG